MELSLADRVRALPRELIVDIACRLVEPFNPRAGLFGKEQLCKLVYGEGDERIESLLDSSYDFWYRVYSISYCRFDEDDRMHTRACMERRVLCEWETSDADRSVCGFCGFRCSLWNLCYTDACPFDCICDVEERDVAEYHIGYYANEHLRKMHADEMCMLIGTPSEPKVYHDAHLPSVEEARRMANEHGISLTRTNGTWKTVIELGDALYESFKLNYHGHLGRRAASAVHTDRD